MRIEVEGNRTTLSEVVERLGTTHEPVELTRGGEVVAKVVAATGKRNGKSHSAKKVYTEAERAEAGRKFWEMTLELRAQTKRAGLSTRQVNQLVDRAVRKVRSENS